MEYWNALRLERTPRLDELELVNRDSDAWGVHPARVRALGESPSDRRIEDLCRGFRNLTLPLEVLVGSKGARRSSPLKRCRIWSTPIPAGAFCKIGEETYVATPEFVFLQQALGESLVRLVQFGFELCGSYFLLGEQEPGLTRCLPLTNRAALERFLDKAQSARGIKRALKAARYIADASASPAETAMVMLACLPRTAGGYGLPLPVMNRRLDVPIDLRRRGSKAWIACDAYWPADQYALEYDGRDFHTGSAAAKDYDRGGILSAMNITVDTITKDELFGVGRFDAVMRRAATHLGIRLRNRDYDRAWELRRDALRREVLAVFRR